MKTVYLIFFPLLLMLTPARGQGVESFQDFPITSGNYSNGSFTGNDGSTWTFSQCRGDIYIEAPTPCLGKRRNPLANVTSGILHYGCGKIIFSYRQAFSTAVNLNLVVNGAFVKNLRTPGGYADTSVVHSTDSICVGLEGDFIIQFRQADSLESGQVCIDNICWTAYTGGVGIVNPQAVKINPGSLHFLVSGRKILRIFGRPGQENLLEVYSMEGKIVRENSFTTGYADLNLEECREGIYVAILRGREKNIIGCVKLVLQ
jgi:hypothetical protein